jgi:hypothetical protein
VTEILEALVGWLLFNMLVMLMLILTWLYNDRRAKGRSRDGAGRLAGLWAQEHRAPPWEPFLAAVEDRPGVLSARRVRTPD